MSTIYNLYMNELKNALREYDEAFAADILEDFEEHFEEGRSNGMTDEEICMELGPVEEVIEAIRQEFHHAEKEDIPPCEEKRAAEGCFLPESGSFRQSAVTRMNVRLLDTGLQLVPGDSDQVRIDYDGNLPQDNFQIFTENDTFYLLEKRAPHFWRGWLCGGRSGKFTVWVPGRIRDLELHTTNGSLRAENLNLDRVEASVTNASLNLRNLTGNELSASSINGSLLVNACRFQTMDVSGGNGKVVVTGEGREVKVSSRNGSLTFEGKAEKYLEASNVNSKIAVTAEGQEVKLGNRNGSITFRGKVEKYLEALNINGGIDVNYQTAEKGASVTLSTNNGHVSASIDGKTMEAGKHLDTAYGERELQIRARTVNGGITLKECQNP